MLNLSTATVTRMVERGTLVRVKVGWNVRFRPEDVEALILNDHDPAGRPGRGETAGPPDGDG